MLEDGEECVEFGQGDAVCHPQFFDESDVLSKLSLKRKRWNWNPQRRYFLRVDVELHRGFSRRAEEKPPTSRCHEEVANELGLSLLSIEAKPHQVRIEGPMLVARISNDALAKMFFGRNRTSQQ